MTSHMVADTSLDTLTWLRSAARRSCRLIEDHRSTKEIQSVLRDETLVAPWRAHTSRTALADAVNHTVMMNYRAMYGECVVAMHIPPIKGMAQVTFISS